MPSHQRVANEYLHLLSFFIEIFSSLIIKIKLMADRRVVCSGVYGEKPEVRIC